MDYCILVYKEKKIAFVLKLVINDKIHLKPFNSYLQNSITNIHVTRVVSPLSYNRLRFLNLFAIYFLI